MIMYLDDPHFCRVMELRDDEERSVDAVHIINTDLRVEFDEPDDVPLQVTYILSLFFLFNPGHFWTSPFSCPYLPSFASI